MMPVPNPHRRSAHAQERSGLRLTQLALGILTLSFTSSALVHAATLTVCPSGCSSITIQGAINAATPGDTIQLVGLATHIEENIIVDRSLTILGAEGDSGGLRAAVTRGTASARALTIQPGVFVEIRNLSIGHGHTLEGGGILNLGQLVLDDVDLVRNDASDWGGGLSNAVGAYAVVRNSVVAENRGGGGTTGGGGGLHNDGTLILERTLVVGNTAPGNGAGIQSGQGNLVLLHTLIDTNDSGGSGGGVEVGGGRLEMRNSYINGNTAQNLGGGIVIFQSTSTLIEQTTVSGNIARTGGGLFTRSSSAPRLHGVTFWSNRANGNGGGLYVYGGKTVRLSSATIATNIANLDSFDGGQGGGIYLGDECTTTICFPGRAFLENSLIGENIDNTDNDTRDCSGNLTSNGYNLVEIGSTGAVGSCKVEGDLTGVLVGVDPGLGPYLDHGGPWTYGNLAPKTVALLESSAAKNAGDPSGCTTSYGAPLPYDQRYAPRVGICDLGAFEFGGVPTPLVPLFNDGFESGNTLLWSSASN
ncbi:MAG: hypothetical protein K8J08_20070 [Thermoanaerobaculia bacterium]|nr:hypothetical protein [Thermoanaerobaculia bacterium]